MPAPAAGCSVAAPAAVTARITMAITVRAGEAGTAVTMHPLPIAAVRRAARSAHLAVRVRRARPVVESAVLRAPAETAPVETARSVGLHLSSRFRTINGRRRTHTRNPLQEIPARGLTTQQRSGLI